MSDSTAPALQRILETLQREITTEQYAEIRSAWFMHVNNEEKLFVPHSAEDGARALDAVMSTLSDDCCFSLPNGDTWKGQDHVREFYHFILSSFDRMVWSPQAVVIGPQGVLDVAQMTATRQNNVFGPLTRTGGPVHVQWVIHWPWDSQMKKFTGETFYIVQYVI